MQMNLAYFDATLRHLEGKGFHIDVQTGAYRDRDEPIFQRRTARCVLSEDCSFSFEALTYENGNQAFYLELLRVGRARSFSFPLDSWKYHPNRIEFKYRDDPETGLGLALTFDLT